MKGEEEKKVYLHFLGINLALLGKERKKKNWQIFFVCLFVLGNMQLFLGSFLTHSFFR